jgi:hypothetical protein
VWKQQRKVSKVMTSKICQAKDLASHDFGSYLVRYQNLPTSHIWLAKSMANCFAILLLAKSLAWKNLVTNQAGPK